MSFLRRRTRKQGGAKAGTEPVSATDAVAELIDREWSRLAHAGTWLTGAERVGIATEARRAVQGGDDPAAGDLSAAITEAARRVATEAASIRPADIERWADSGLDEWAYVELVGIVSRLSAVDVAAFGLGWEERALPAPMKGEPTRVRADGAERTKGWVPTVGPASAPSSLSAVTAEHDAMFDVHGTLYLTMEQMGDHEIVRDDLERAQMELVAARTSKLNDCFY